MAAVASTLLSRGRPVVAASGSGFPMKVRCCEPADRAALKTLFLHQRQHLDPQSPASDLIVDASEDLQATIHVIDLFGGVLLVCESESGCIVGMATLTLTGSYPVPRNERAMRKVIAQAGTDQPAQLMSVWVEAEHRGRGAGAMLVGEGIDWACRQGVTEITLTHAPAAMHLAVFYQRLGFEPC